MSDSVSGDRRLFELVRILAERKRDEADARAARIRAEEQLVEATGFAKPSGSQSYKGRVDGVGSYSVTLKQPVTLSVIGDRLLDLKKRLRPSIFKKVFRTKFEPVAKELRSLEEADRDTWLEVMEVLSKKPGKVGVEVKGLEVI